MKITAIRNESPDGSSVGVIFEGFGGMTVDVSTLLNRKEFLSLVGSKFEHRGVTDAPKFQDDWEIFVREIFERTNPQLQLSE